MVDRLVRLDAVWEADLPNLTEIQIARGEAGSKRVARDHGRWTSILVAGEGAVVDACHRQPFGTGNCLSAQGARELGGGNP